jgi:hypothetical protein
MMNSAGGNFMKIKTTTTIRLLGLATLIGCYLAYANIASAAESHLITSHDTGPVMNPVLFKGVDTLAVDDSFNPGETAKLLGLTHNESRPTIISEVQKIFSDAAPRLPVSAVVIKPAFNMDIHDLQKPNALVLSFILSAREEMFAGQPVRVANLAMRLGNLGSKDMFAEEATYPFVVPDTQQELQQRIRDGVFYLSSFLPSYYTCGNKRGYPTNECPDCRPSACNLDKPYGGKQ